MSISFNFGGSVVIGDVVKAIIEHPEFATMMQASSLGCRWFTDLGRDEFFHDKLGDLSPADHRRVKLLLHRLRNFPVYDHHDKELTTLKTAARDAIVADVEALLVNARREWYDSSKAGPGWQAPRASGERLERILRQDLQPVEM